MKIGLLFGLTIALGFGFAAPSAVRAGDDPAPKQRVTWAFEKGEEGSRETLTVDVTDLSEPLRADLKAKYEAKGYAFKGESHAGLHARVPEGAPLPQVKPDEPRKGVEDAVDGGRGLEPRLMLAVTRAMGRLFLKYAEDAEDPEKAAAYRDIFRALGGVMAKADEKDPGGLAAAAMKALVETMPSMKDPKRAAVLGDVMRTLVGAMADEGTKALRESDAVRRRPLVARVLDGLHEGIESLEARAAPGGARVERLGTGLQGFHVLSVVPGSASAQLGLLAEDTIIEIDGGAATPAALRHAAQVIARGGELSLAVLRQGKRITLKSSATPGPR